MLAALPIVKAALQLKILLKEAIAIASTASHFVNNIEGKISGQPNGLVTAARHQDRAIYMIATNNPQMRCRLKCVS